MILQGRNKLALLTICFKLNVAFEFEHRNAKMFCYASQFSFPSIFFPLFFLMQRPNGWTWATAKLETCRLGQKIFFEIDTSHIMNFLQLEELCY